MKAKISFAKLNNCKISPRKVKLLADTIRGKEVFAALTLLEYSPKYAAKYLEKLLKSAISNWEQKNETTANEDNKLFVKEILIGSAGMLKRIQPAPHGRAHRIRKRMSKITIIVDNINNK